MNLFLLGTKTHKFSINALLGAVESLPFFERLRLELPTKATRLIDLMREVCASAEPRPTVVGISFFSTELPEIIALAGELKSAAGGKALLVAGGPHPTGDPQGTLAMGFDLVVCGEGEETFRELLHRLFHGLDYGDIPGLAYRDRDGAYRFTGRRSPVMLDDFPPFSAKSVRFGPIEITRGCPFVCSYCQTPQLHGGKVRHRSLDHILRSVEIMAGRGLMDARFITPNAFSYGSHDGRALNCSALRELLVGVRRIVGNRGRIFFGSFPSEVRPEQVTPETIALVTKYADNDNLVFGAQTGSPRMLDKCRRAHTVDDVYRATRLTVAAGLAPYVDFIFGLPGETEADMRMSLAMMRDLVAMGASVNAHTFMPLPMTPLASQPAGWVSGEIRREMGTLIASGRAFGGWLQQERHSRMIAAYRQAGRTEGGTCPGDGAERR